jgi:predicted nucleic acid-binding Zn ribbon protein
MTRQSDLPARTLADVRKHSRRTKSQSKSTQPSGPQYSGSGASDRDPMLADRSLDELVKERGWERRSAVGSVIGRWPELVGANIAAHAVPEHFEESSATLHVSADSGTWATQLRLLTPAILARLDAEVGAGVVKSILVTTKGRASNS